MMSNLVEQYVFSSKVQSKLKDRDEQSVGGAIFQTSIQIGASIGTCLASLVSTTRAETTGDLARGLKDGFWMLAAFAWLGRSIHQFARDRVLTGSTGGYWVWIEESWVSEGCQRGQWI